ncbi:MAG TPA: SIMPL domain-containing protein [Gallionella sp.]|nr:SIMPL domain-containing protein [Gallionella sp.]
MLRIVFLGCLLSFSLFARAEPEPYNRVDFQVEAAREVANDLLQATLSVELQDKQPARVAQQLNTRLNEALKQASAFSTVKASSGNQNTYPVYGKNHQIDTWRGHGDIRLQSRDFKAAAELVMQLQASLQLTGLQFSIAPETRAQTENALIAEAIKAFQQRAEMIRNVTGAKSYMTVHYSISSGDIPRPYPVGMMRSMAADATIPQPEFAGGESRLSVQINGTIELH